MKSRRCLVICGAVSLVLSTPGVTTAQELTAEKQKVSPKAIAEEQKVLVEGIVTSSALAGEAIIGVTVRADRDGRPVGATKTDSSGFYRLAIDEGAAFDLVYDHSSWHPDTLKRLSGAKSHTVNKVLYRPGSEKQYSSAAIFAILASYEHVYFLAAGTGTLADVRGPYGERLRAMAFPDFDGEVGRLIEDKRKIVISLFGTGPAVAGAKIR